MKYEIDKIDLDILKNLSSNAKISFTDLASKILVSPSTVHVRVKKWRMQESLKILQLISIIVCSVLLLLGIWVFF